MIEKQYLILRKLFFWAFTFLFIFFVPFLIYYSLGYKFNLRTKKFVKTSIISLESQPQGAKVFLNKKDLKKTTPCVIRDILPGKYEIIIKREDFYPYKIKLELRPNLVKKIKAVLIPLQKDIEKIAFNFNVYRFFPLKSFFNTKFITFTNKGICLIDKNFDEFQYLTKDTFDENTIASLLGMLFVFPSPLFWNQNNIWRVKKNEIINIYKAEELIKNVLWGPQKKYILIQDGLKIIALDIEEPQVRIDIFKLRSIKAQVYYSVSQEALYIKDKLPKQNKFSLFKVKLKSLIHPAREYFFKKHTENKKEKKKGLVESEKNRESP